MQSQLVERSSKNDMKKIGTGGEMEKFKALEEYISFEEAMSKCIRVWDLEDDYLKMSQVQSALILLQFWFRKHQKIKRRKEELEVHRNQSEARAASRRASDLER